MIGMRHLDHALIELGKIFEVTARIEKIFARQFQQPSVNRLFQRRKGSLANQLFVMKKTKNLV